MRSQSERSLSHAFGNLDALGAKSFHAARSDRVGVAHGHHYSPNPGVDDGPDARRCPTVVSAGLEGDENGAASSPVPGLGEGVNLCMRSSAAGMVSLAGDQAFGVENNRSHHGVWGGADTTTGSEIESMPHPVIVHRIDRIAVCHRLYPIHRERFPVARRLSMPSVAFRVFDI